MRDSNPRMPGPEPGALPLGESPRREEKENIFSFSDRRMGQFYEVKPSQKGATPRISPNTTIIAQKPILAYSFAGLG